MNTFRWIARAMAVLNGLLGILAGIYLIFPVAYLFQFRNWKEAACSLGCILIAIPGYVLWWTYLQASRNKPTQRYLWLVSAAYNGLGVALGLFVAYQTHHLPPLLLWPVIMTGLSLWAWRLASRGSL
ncbi:MAG: hypothetical protein SFU85_05255 [Candidatus Methylacidiphilales bacterium]|nr:hypothetical protein [Candidatus Methylacidiphilales bacterium]